MIRLCTKEDIEWLMEIAIDCYPEFNVQSSRAWLEKNIENPDVFVARGDECAALAYISRTFYAPAQFEVDFIVSRKTRFGAKEVLDLLAFLNSMRKAKQFNKTWINSRLADLWPFVRKLGGRVGGTSWVVED